MSEGIDSEAEQELEKPLEAVQWVSSWQTWQEPGGADSSQAAARQQGAGDQAAAEGGTVEADQQVSH